MNNRHFAIEGSTIDMWRSAAGLRRRGTAIYDGSPGPLVTNGLIVCGPPRSGTTWLHNTLIEIGRYRGVLGDDMHGTDSRSLFLTDENAYIHRLLARVAESNECISQNFWTVLLQTAAALNYLRFGRNRGLILKSPYYCFFLDALRRARLGQKFIYMKRSPEAVANSMLSHPHLSRLLRLDYDSNFEVKSDRGNLELLYVPIEIASRYRDDYARLTLFDRALFKYLCFSCSFAATRYLLGREDVFIFDYGMFGASREHQECLFLFLDLTEMQRINLMKSFRRPSNATKKPLPAHDPDFRAAVLRAEAAVWQRSSQIAPHI